MGKIEIRNFCFRYGKQMVLNNLWKSFLRTADGTEVYRNQRNDRRRRLYEQKGGFRTWKG